MNAMNALLVLANAFLLVAGQFLWKMGLGRTSDALAGWRSAVELLMSPFIWSGLAIYAVATVMWLYILSRADLSVAYPMQSVAYVIAAVGAYYVFGEPLSALKIAGCIVILIGVGMIGYSARLS